MRICAIKTKKVKTKIHCTPTNAWISPNLSQNRLNSPNICNIVCQMRKIVYAVWFQPLQINFFVLCRFFFAFLVKFHIFWCFCVFFKKVLPFLPKIDPATSFNVPKNLFLFFFVCFIVKEHKNFFFKFWKQITHIFWAAKKSITLKKINKKVQKSQTIHTPKTSPNVIFGFLWFQGYAGAGFQSSTVNLLIASAVVTTIAEHMLSILPAKSQRWKA